MKVLANDGIAPDGKAILEKGGAEVHTEKIAQDALAEGLKPYDAILVRSATKVTKDIIQANPQLKVIGRAGVGLDNIDLDAAKDAGVEVVNTPAASSISVAELVFAHLSGMIRFLHLSNIQMREQGNTAFKDLKKSYAKGVELRGKTMGIIGFGRIGRETAKIAIGYGMKVIAHDPMMKDKTAELPLDHLQIPISIGVPVPLLSKEDLLAQSDFISLHVPSLNTPIIDEHAFQHMKEGVGLVNCARGGVVDEAALEAHLASGKVKYAALDVFENEPTPKASLLENDKISLSPHIGASTSEAQTRIGIELAEKVMKALQ